IPFRRRIDSSKPTCRQNRCCKNGSDHRFRFPSGSQAGKRLLEEDLRSPCTEEIAVFQAFSRVIREAGKRFVVMDTAPTGHTLLLLDATGAYHREIARKMGDKGHFTTPMMQLQD
ncbi:ArsA-related P-loop ATPase, partial [Escherichia coli]